MDPNEADLERTSDALREQGFRVVSLSRYEPTVPLFSVFRPDLVLLAAQGPEFAAVGLARRLRQLRNGATPILYLVDDPGQETRTYCLEKGMALDVFPKPLELPELVAKVHSLLNLVDAVGKKARTDAELHTPTLHDPLTGTHTRRYLLSLIGMETRRCERYGGSFSLVGCELKGTAQFKKAMGKDLAERLLVYVSVVLSQTVREADVVARVDEESFALLLPGTPTEGVRVMQERLASRFELARFHVEGKAFGTSVSLGSVSFPDRTGTATQLLAAAFQDLRRTRDAPRIGSATGIAL
ncbi:MAG: diguanylate cyclase [Myxococcota bacterium]|nr:diguanylate cyclase [Myxococcota bacterium]